VRGNFLFCYPFKLSLVGHDEKCVLENNKNTGKCGEKMMSTPIQSSKFGAT
jgi:hypothetical protein